MFTGIVEELGAVKSLAKAARSARLTIESKVCASDAKIGDSISINGACLTVVDVKGKMIKAYVESYEQLKGHFQKPLVTWVGGPDSSIIAELTQRLEELGFPVFRDLETSIKALAMALRFTNIKKRVAP